MATTSPMSSAFVSSTPPPKQSPNSHPYAIKSSSSAILSRSASSPSDRTFTQHHFVPLITSSPSPKKSRYVVSRKHSYPAVGVTPSPIPTPDILPTPPLTVRVKRRETVSTAGWGSKSDDAENDLPPNPKLWTPSQLATYLSSSFRLKGDAKLPAPVARDIAAFIIKERISGRAFLRMTRQDYDLLGINTLWKSALGEASRALRQNLVRGRIMGFGNGASTSLDDLSLNVDEEDEEDGDLQLSRDPLHFLDPSSTRSPSSYTPWDRKRTLGRFKAGRVKGMIESFERTGSESGSGSEGEWGAWRGRGSESGSENGDAEVEVEVVYPGATDESSMLEDGMTFNPQEINVPLPTMTSTSAAEILVQPDSVHEDFALSPAMSESLSTVEPTISTPANPKTNPNPEVGSEPSIETLLTILPEPEAGLQPRSWGAKAWEDDPVHTTARRVPLTGENTVSGMAMGAESLEKLDVGTEGSAKRINGRKKVKTAEGLARLFERHTDGEARDSGIGDVDERKDSVAGKAANEADLELGAIKHNTNAAETLVQQTAEPSFCPPVLEAAPAVLKDELEAEVTSTHNDLHTGPLQFSKVNELPPVLDAILASSSLIPTETDTLLLEPEVSVPEHLPPILPACEDSPASSIVAPATFPDPSPRLPEPLPAQPMLDLTNLTISTSELQASLITVQERLEMVEHRLDELETRDAEREAELKRLRQIEKERAVQAEPRQDDETDTQERLFATSEGGSPSNYAAPDPSIESLPAFVLLASLGIASIVVGSLVRVAKRRK